MITDPKFGVYDWHKVQIGQRVLISQGYVTAVSYLKKRNPGTDWASTIKGAPEGKRIVTRLA